MSRSVHGQEDMFTAGPDCTSAIVCCFEKSSVGHGQCVNVLDADIQFIQSPLIGTDVNYFSISAISIGSPR